jgi:beta-ribofuranosylaminobenzene 5'-phosphate synthase
MVKVITPSRLHIALIDMNASLGRVDGGAGIALESPNIVISAEKSEKAEVVASSSIAPDIVGHAARSAKIMEKKYGACAKIHIEKAYRPHVGLGSGTQTRLAVASAINKLYRLGLSVREMAIAVQRGGTSGIGVTAFEKGGFILDGGHRFLDKKDFLPSSLARAPPPPIILRHDFPNWDIIIATPDTESIYRKNEADHFQVFCPVPLNEVRSLSHVVLMKMLPALFEADARAFGDSINDIQKLGFKRREIELRHPIVKKIMKEMLRSGAYGAGMSSFGPTVYGIADDADEVRKAVQELLERSVGGEVKVVRAANKVAKVI